MSRFSIEGEGLDSEALVSEVERRVGKAIEAGPPPSPPPDDAPRTVTDLFGELLRSLAENADTTQGFPPQSHRSFGSALVAAKKGFRLAFQPLINEALSRQKIFNHRLLDALAALRAEQQSLDARLAAIERGKAPRKGAPRRAAARVRSPE
jgi:hypothetical protein